MEASSICWGRSCDKIESSRMFSEGCSQGQAWTLNVSLQIWSAVETLRWFKSSHSCKCRNIICQYYDGNNWAFDVCACVCVLTSNQGERRSSCAEWTLVAPSRKTLLKINQHRLKHRFPRSERCGVVCVRVSVTGHTSNATWHKSKLTLLTAKAADKQALKGNILSAALSANNFTSKFISFCWKHHCSVRVPDAMKIFAKSVKNTLISLHMAPLLT